MNDTLIVTVYVVLDDVLRAMEHRTDRRAQTSDSEVLTVGVIAACQFANHHERALCILHALGYLSGPLSVSRFNRRFHALAHRLSDAVDFLARLLTAGTIFIIDSMPLPVCRRAGMAVPQGTRRGVLRLLCREEGKVLRLAVASDRLPRRHSGFFRSAARVVSRPHPGARVDGAVAEWSMGLRGQGVQ